MRTTAYRSKVQAVVDEHPAFSEWLKELAGPSPVVQANITTLGGIVLRPLGTTRLSRLGDKSTLLSQHPGEGNSLGGKTHKRKGTWSPETRPTSRQRGDGETTTEKAPVLGLELGESIPCATIPVPSPSQEAPHHWYLSETAPLSCPPPNNLSEQTSTNPMTMAASSKAVANAVKRKGKGKGKEEAEEMMDVTKTKEIMGVLKRGESLEELLGHEGKANLLGLVGAVLGTLEGTGNLNVVLKAPFQKGVHSK